MTQIRAENWFASNGWKVFPFQTSAWKHYNEGFNGIVNAPTGSGKTYSLMVPILQSIEKGKGLQAIWITPIRALSKEILQSTEKAAKGLDLEVKVAVRTGDTSTKDKTKLKKSPPDILITTPETIHLLLAQKGYDSYFKNVKAIVMDEWHEMMGSKRGVQIELALSRLKSISPQLRIWGISATIGNMEESLQVLLGNWHETRPKVIVKSKIKKKYI